MLHLTLDTEARKRLQPVQAFACELDTLQNWIVLQLY